MSPNNLFHSKESGAGELIALGPEQAGWQYAGLRILELTPGTVLTVLTGDSEVFVLPLSGGATIEVSDAGIEHAGIDHAGIDDSEVTDAERATQRFVLTGRPSVFSQVSDFLYAGRDSRLRLSSSAPALLALPSARCENRRRAAYGPASEVPVEVRGAGSATRQVTNFGVPGGWDHAERLMCCELITPAGNWSSYPPHKHDSSPPCTVANEEIYYYRIAGPDQLSPSRQGFGLHCTYTAAEHQAAGLPEVADTLAVRDGDVVLVRHGYHGPCVAAPGYPMYYLNVLAGPGPQRSMAFCDDPEHGWVRDSWAAQPADPRCPVTSADGLVRTADSTDRN